MRLPTSTCQLAWLSTLLFGFAHAQDVDLSLGEIRVTGRPSGTLTSRRILTSVDVLGADRLQDKQVMQSWELLAQVPGMQLTSFNLGAESGKPSFRAFNGEGYINGIKLLIDGIPSNINSGNLRYFDMIFPLDLDEVEVVRGTNDPRYGLHNIGGNIQLHTRQGGDYTEARFSAGSFATRDVQAVLGRETDELAQNYFVGWQKRASYRAHADSEKFGLGGKWFHRDAQRGLKVGVIARHYQQEAQEAGYLTASELAADPSQSPARNANDHDIRSMSQLSAHLDYAPSAAIALASKLYFNTIDDERFLTYSSYAGSTAPRQRRHWQEEHSGWLTTLRWSAQAGLILEGGINLEQQRNQYRRDRYAYALPSDFSTPAATANDDRYSLNNTGAYVQAVITPSEQWKIVPAYRVDHFSGHTTLSPSGTRASLQDYGAISQPKLSVVYTPQPRLHLYANWGRTFQILTGSRGPAYMTTGTPAYQPSINTGQELGVKFAPLPGVESRLAVWQQDASDEVANLPSAGSTQNLGQTRRRGVDLQLAAQLSERTRVWLSQAWQEAKVVGGYSSNGQSLNGKQVFSTPRHISNAGLSYAASAAWQLGVQGRAQGDYYIDDLNQQGKFGGYAVLDASVRYRHSERLSVDFEVKNLFNRQYAYVWYDNFFWPAGSYQAMYSPAPGRAAYLSLKLSH